LAGQGSGKNECSLSRISVKRGYSIDRYIHSNARRDPQGPLSNPADALPTGQERESHQHAIYL
jgi:hypothetical protein